MALIPLGVLAAEGLEVVLRWRTSARRAGFVAVAVGTVVALAFAAPSWQLLVRHGFGIDPDERHALAAEHELSYERGAALRDAVTVPGDLYVLGSPLLNHVTDRPLATRVHGWTGDQLRDEEWEDLIGDLEHDPPAVVVVSDPFAHLPDEEGQSRFWQVLDDGYCEV
ncbi:hypothetical protein B7486_79455, partial [cyanobacterium TDX16]